MLQVRILTVGDSLRNEDLISDIVKFIPISNIKIVSGFDGTKVNFSNDPRIGKVQNINIIGRDLTSPEVACLLGHHHIYLEKSSDWFLVLEDDASLSDLLSFGKFLEYMYSSHFTGPNIISLFEGRNRLRTLRSFFHLDSPEINRLLVPSTGTVAYLINEEARHLAGRQSVLFGTADWPTWVLKCKFYESKNFLFKSKEDTSSLIVPAIPKEYSKMLPKYLRSKRQMIMNAFNRDLINAFGGFTYYFRITFPKFLAQIYLFRLINHLSDKVFKGSQ